MRTNQSAMGGGALEGAEGGGGVVAGLSASAGDRLGPPEDVFLLLDLPVDDLLQLLLYL